MDKNRVFFSGPVWFWVETDDYTYNDKQNRSKDLFSGTEVKWYGPAAFTLLTSSL